jgi:hypothetical protein
MVVQLIDGVFFVLWLPLDDHEGSVDVVDRQDVAVNELILHEVADVLVFLVLFHTASPLRQQLLNKETITFSSCCYFKRLASN